MACSQDVANEPQEIIEEPNSEFEESDVHSNELVIIEQLNYNALVASLGNERLASIVEQPNEDGALGRNKDGYFHVRFQLGMTRISDFAISTQRLDALEGLFSTIDYALKRQLAEGDFELNIPEEIQNLPEYRPLTEGDLASGTAFFASSLGTSILSLQNADWFTRSEETATQRNTLATYEGQFQKLLDYLIENQNILKDYDQTAPNRLLLDALAYFTLGRYLNNKTALNLSEEFIALAIALMDTTEGYFLENGGWDSSYNGVSLQTGFELLSLMQYQDTESLEGTLLKATSWQISRILESGEISTEDNTRVFPGGESFLGQEKEVDYAKTVRALYYLSSLTNNDSHRELAERVLDFYE